MPSLKGNIPQNLAFENFMKGHISRIPPERVPMDAFSDSQNISLTENFLPTAALGQVKYNASAMGAYPVRGGAVYVTASGTKYYVAACGGFIWYSVAGSGTWAKYQVTVGGNPADMTVSINNDVEFAQYNGKLYAVNGQYPIITNTGYTTTRMIKIEGTTVTGLVVADIPQGLQYIWVDKERLFGANSIAQPCGLFWTNAYFDYATNSEANWTPTSGLNYDYVGKDDGETITGIFPYQNGMLVLKPRNVYAYATNGDITNWGSIRVDTTRGCPFNRTVKEMDGYIYWLSFDGVVQFDGTNVVLVDDNIRPDIIGIPQLSSYSRQWNIGQTADYNAGTFGNKIIGTSDNQITLLSQHTQADWNAGTKSAVDTSTTPGDVQVWTLWDNDPQPIDSDVNGLIDLGAAMFVTNVYFHSYPYIGTLQASVDGLSWTTIDHGTYQGSHFFALNAVYRYFRNTGTYQSTMSATVYVKYPASGSITTQTLDYGLTPVTFGNLAASITTPTGTSIIFQTRSSSDGATWSAFANVGTAGENGGVINSTLNRYLQVKAILYTDTTRQYTPVLHSIYVGAQWDSAVTDLGTTPATWGLFDVSYLLNAQTMTIWMRSAATSGGVAAATWYQQTPGQPVTGAAVNRYVQVEVRLNTTTATQIPLMQGFRVTWYTSTPLLKPCAYTYNREYCLNVADVGQTANNVVWRYSPSMNYWLKRTNKYNNIYFLDEGILLSGTSQSDGYVRINETGSSDDGVAIDPWFVTKNVPQGSSINIFERFIAAYAADQSWTLSYSTNGGSTWTDITISASSAITSIRRVLQGRVLGSFMMLKCRQPNIDANWRIEAIGMEFQAGFAKRND